MPDCDKRELLFVAGEVTPARAQAEPVEIRRGMPVRSRDGALAGRVAAVAVDAASQAVTHVLLSRWREVFDYRLVPVSLVGGVEDGAVVLDVSRAEVDSLPPRAET